MNARQGKIIVAAAVLVLTALLLRAALRSSNWVGFVVSEAQILVPMVISWWLFMRYGDERARGAGESGANGE